MFVFAPCALVCALCRLRVCSALCVCVACGMFIVCVCACGCGLAGVLVYVGVYGLLCAHCVYSCCVRWVCVVCVAFVLCVGVRFECACCVC